MSSDHDDSTVARQASDELEVMQVFLEGVSLGDDRPTTARLLTVVARQFERCNVKAEPENDEPMTPQWRKLPVTDLLFAQASVVRAFSDGSSFRVLVDELRHKGPGWPLRRGYRGFL